MVSTVLHGNYGTIMTCLLLTLLVSIGDQARAQYPNEEDNEGCSVCQVSFQVVVRQALVDEGHISHRNHVERWHPVSTFCRGGEGKI